MSVVPQERNSERIRTSGSSSPEAYHFWDMQASALKRSENGSSDLAAARIRHKNVFTEVQSRAAHRTFSSSCPGSWRHWTRKCGSPAVALVLVVLCLLYQPVSAVQCTPCPGSCTCSQTTGTIEGCIVNCSNAQLKQFPTGLPAPDTILSLYLHDNNLRHLSFNTLSPMINLQTLSLHDNPLTCDCQLIWLPQWLSFRCAEYNLSVEAPDEIKCDSPDALRDRPLASLSLSEFSCGDISFYSCVKSKDSLGYTKVVFTNHYDNILHTSACRKTCFDNDFSFGLFTKWLMAGSCSCGDVPEYDMSQCSCTDGTGHELPSGTTNCNLLYIGGSWLVDDHSLTLDTLQPASTSKNVFLRASAKIPFEYYSWEIFPTLQKIQRNNPQLANNFYYAERYNISVVGVSNDRQSRRMSFQLNVLDPINVELGVDEIYADVDKTLNITAHVRSGTEFSVTWTYTDNSSQTNQEAFCPNNWFYIGRRCIGFVSDQAETFDGARRLCEENKAQLLRLRYTKELKVIVKRVVQGNSNQTVYYYLGAKKQSGKPSYIWVDTGRLTQFTEFNVSLSADGPCVAGSSPYKLQATSCDVRYRFMCQTDPVVCKIGSIFDDDTKMCYYVTPPTTTTTYRAAAKICKQNNGELAEIETSENSEFLKRTISSQTSYWIGLNSLDELGAYTWSGGRFLGQFAPWKLGHEEYRDGKCVAMVLDVQLEMNWELRECDDNLPYVCQYPPGGVRYTVQNYITGEPGVLGIGPSSFIEALSQNIQPTVDITSVVLLGLGLSHSGTLHTWYIDVRREAEESWLNLMVLRPSCPDGYYLITPRHRDATTRYAVCSRNMPFSPVTRRCGRGEQFCILSQTCISVFRPCTCVKYPTASICFSSDSRDKRSVSGQRERSKRWSMAPMSTSVNYKVVGTTMLKVGGTQYGLIQVKTSSIRVQKDDVLGFQYSGYQNPLRHLNAEHNEWNTDISVVRSKAFLHPTDTMQLTLAKDQEKAFALLALYSNPVPLVPSEPYLDKTYYGVGNFTYTVHVQNAISRRTASILVRFQKRVNSLTILMRAVLRPIGSRNNSYECYLESYSSHGILVVIRRGSDVSLRVDRSGSTRELPFSPDCPSQFEEQCLGQFPSRSAQFAVVTFNAGSVTPDSQPISMTFNASNRISWQSASLDIHIRETISGLQVDVASSEFLVNEAILFRMNLKSGSHVRFKWHFSDNQDDAQSQTVKHLYKMAGRHTVDASACNELNCVNTSLTVTACNEARVNNWIVDKPDGVYEDEMFYVNVSLQTSLWSQIDISVYYGDHSVDDESFNTETETVIRRAFAHVYSSPGDYRLVVSLIDRLIGRTINITEAITVCRRYSNATIGSNKYAAVSSRQRFEAFLGEHRLGMQYEWQFGDGARRELTFEPYVYHVYNVSGQFAVSVRTRSCADDVTASTTIVVQQPIYGLAVRCQPAVAIGDQLVVNISYESGTDVSIVVFDGQSYRNVSDAGSLESVHFTYAANGTYNISATAWNMVSEDTMLKTVYVYGSSAFDVVDVLDGDVVPLNQDTTFSAVVLYKQPQSLSYLWNFGDGTSVQTGRTVTHTYTALGVYVVTVTASRRQENKSFNKNIYVEETLEDLKLYTNSTLALSKGSFVMLYAKAKVRLGSNFQFIWNLNGTEFANHDDELTTEVKRSGKAVLKVKAVNRVSSLEEQTLITIVEEIKGLTIQTNATEDDNDTPIFKMGEIYFIAATIRSGTCLTYTWHIEGSSKIGQSIYYTFQNVGPVTLKVTAENILNTIDQHITGYVLQSVSNVSLRLNTSTVLTFTPVRVSVISQATNMTCRFRICFRQQCRSVVSENGAITWKFENEGLYDVTAYVSNPLDSGWAYLAVDAFHRIKDLIILVNGSNRTRHAAVNNKTTFEAVVESEGAVMVNWTIVKPDGGAMSFSGEQFSLELTEIGSHRVTLEAFNGAMRKTKTLVLRVVELIQEVRIATDAIDGTYMTMETPHTFEARYRHGTELTFDWTLITPTSTIKIKNRSFAYRFVETGWVTVTLYAENALSMARNKTVLAVESVIQDLKIRNNVTNSSYIPVGIPVRYKTDDNNFWPINYTWQLMEGSATRTYNGCCLDYIFQSAGTINISLNASNHVSYYESATLVMAEEKIKFVTLLPQKVTTYTEVNVTFTALLTSGSNVMYYWNFGDLHKIRTDIASQSFSFPAAGSYVVSVLAANDVSRVTNTSSVTVVEQIGDVYIVNCCKMVYQVDAPLSFEADVTSGTVTNYNWTWIRDGQSRSAVGKVFQTSFPAYGTYWLGVTAYNDLDSDSESVDVYAEERIETVHLRVIGDLLGFVTMKLVTFKAIVPRGDPVDCSWLLNSTVICSGQNDSMTCQHRFSAAGMYVVSVLAYNNISLANDTQVIQVHPFLCDQPKLTLVGDAHRTENKSNSVRIDVTVDACTKYSLVHKWTIYRKPCIALLTSVDQIQLPDEVSSSTPLLYLPPRTLDYGNYCLRFESNYNISNASHAPFINVSLSVEKTPLRAVIIGGHKMVISVEDRIIIDGSLSYDPDLHKSDVQLLTYLWTCFNSKNEPCFNSANTSVIVIEPNTFREGESYNISLLVTSPDGRQATAHQKIIGRSAQVPIVTIDCVSCRELNVFKVCRSQVVKLLGDCQNCQSDISIHWQVQQDDGTSLVLNDTTTTTGPNTKNLVIKAGSLLSGKTYHFMLNVTTLKTNRSGSAILTLYPSLPPSDGKCEALHPRIVTAVEDFVYVRCAGWIDNSGSTSPLVYDVYVTNRYGEWYPIYRGTQSEVISVLSPFRKDYEDVSLIVTITDNMGMSTVGLNQTVWVMSADLDTDESRLSRIQLHIEKRLPIVQRAGNPKLLLSYTITLILELNREATRYDSVAWSEDKETRTKLRQDLLTVLKESLVTIPAIDDVQQTAYALNLLTKHPSDFPKGHSSYKVVLDLCKEMLDTIAPEISQGWTGKEFVPEYLLSIFSNMIQIIHAELSRAAIEGRYDSGLWMRRRDTMQLVMMFAENVTSALLSTQVANEEPYWFECGVANFTGQRVMAKDIRQAYSDDGFGVFFPRDIVAHLPPETELFQTLNTSLMNPYLWGFADGLPLNSHVVAPKFAFTNGSDVSVHDLPSERQFHVSFNRSPFHDKSFWEELKDQLLPAPNMTHSVLQRSDNGTEFVFLPTELTYTSSVLEPKSHLSSRLPQTDHIGEDGAVGFHLLVTVYETEADFPHADMGNASLYIGVGYMPHKYKFDQVVHIPLEDLGWSNPADAVWQTSFNWLGRPTDHNEIVYLTLNNDDPHLTLNMSVATYLSICKYYDPKTFTWKTDGCHVTEASTATWTTCRCNHMTTFGSTVFLAPSDLEFKDILKLDFRSNPVVISSVCGLAFLLLVAFLMARRWDKMDTEKVSRMPLCGKDGAFKYEVTIVTGRHFGAGTSAHVGLRLYGKEGRSQRYFLNIRDAFHRASIDTVIVATESSLGDLSRLHIWHDNYGLDPSWYVSRVVVRDLQNDNKYYFIVEGWLSLSYGDYVIEKKVTVAAPEELHGFKSLFKAKLSEGFSDDHIFLSVFDRPPQASFTRVQRVVCCATFLYLYMFVNAVWFGLLRTPTERELLTGDSPLQWLDILVGILASLVVFPVSTVIQQMFKYAKHKTTSVGVALRRPSAAQTVEMDTMISLSSRASDTQGSRDARRASITMNSKLQHDGKLRRTVAVMRIGQDGNLALSDTSSLQSVPQSDNNLWSNDGILAWPDQLPTTGHSRQSSDSSTATRFLYDRRSMVEKPKRKASTVTMESNMIELEEIEDDDIWKSEDNIHSANDLTENNAVPGSGATDDDASQLETALDENTWNSSESSVNHTASATGTTSKPTAAGKAKNNVTKRQFSPRTDADIDNLIEELDAVINGETLTKYQMRLNNGVANSSSHVRSEGTVNVSARSRKLSECSLQDVRPSILTHRDSLALARRGSVSFDGSPLGQPLKPSTELTSISGATDPNLWAWSRPSTQCSVPQYIPTGPVTDTRRCVLPYWCVHLAYAICALITSLSILMVLIYGQAFGMDLSLRWLLACFFTVVLSIFLMEPVKVVVIAVIISLTSDTLETNTHRLGVQPILEVNEKIKDDVKVKPVSGFALLQAREEGRKVHRMHSMLRSFFLYLGLMVTIVATCGMYHTEEFYRMVDFTTSVLFESRCLNDTAFGSNNKKTTTGFFQIITCEEMWHFLKQSAAPWLHQYELFPLDTSFVLLAVARLRQIRSYTGQCPAASYLHKINRSHLVARDCWASPDMAEDTAPYDVGWNQSTNGNYSWWYTPADRNSLRYRGNVSDYSGGGYVQNLGKTLEETIRILNDLQKENWVDRGTRAVILEFTLYNVNRNHYVVNRLAFEFPLSGGVVTSRELFSTSLMRYESGRVSPLIVIQFILLALDVWLAIHVLQRMCGECKRYLSSFWSWLELSLFLGITSSIGLYVVNVVRNTSNFTSYFDNRNEFVDFTKDAYLCYVWQCVNAFNLFMIMMTVVHQLRYIKCLSIFLEIMHKTRRKIFNMFIIFVLIICTYAFVGFLWYGHTVYPFHSIANSLGTMAAIFRSSGYFFDDLLIIDIHFTTFFILTFCWLMFVMVFGLLLAVITDAYHDVRSHKGYLDSLDGKDYEMIDFVLERLKIILKVKKLKPAFRRVKFQGLSTLSSTSSRTTASSVKTQSQTTSSLTSDPFDIDWDEVTKDDTNTVAEHVEQRWECLLDKLHQLEEYEQEEDHFYNRIMQMFGYDTNCPNQRFGTKGKMPVSGKVSAKGSSSNRGMKKKRTKTDAKLVAEKLQIEDLEVENPDPARLQRPIDSTELQSKPSGKPRQRNVFTRSQSTSVMTNKTQLECKPVRAISSASQMCPAATQPDRNRLAQSPIYEGIHKAWSE